MYLEKWNYKGRGVALFTALGNLEAVKSYTYTHSLKNPKGKGKIRSQW